MIVAKRKHANTYRLSHRGISDELSETDCSILQRVLDSLG